MADATITQTPIERHNFLSEGNADVQGADDIPVVRPDNIPWQRDLLVMFLRNQIRVAPAMPILAFLLAITATQWTPVGLSMVWLAAALGCQLFQVYLCHRYFRKERSHDDPRDWMECFRPRNF